MNENTEKKNEVPENVYTCILTGYATRVEKTYGRDATAHLILRVGVMPEGVENAQTYYAELPLVYTPGENWAFYNRTMKANEERPCTAEDTKDAWNYARKCLPDWAKYVDGLEDGDIEAAIAWFNAELSKGTKCRCKLTNREYTDRDGVSKTAHEARFYENQGGLDLSGLGDSLGKAIKASGIRIGKKAKQSEAAAPSAPTAPTAPTAPSAPSAPAAPSAQPSSNYEQCWNFYRANLLRTDPQAAKFWERCGELCGKSPMDHPKWTGEDWGKVLAGFQESAGVSDLPF